MTLGVDYIIHITSPFYFNVTDHSKDFYKPAIHGTMEILKVTNKEETVQSITSSVGAVINPEKFVPAR